jgi:hypothetical protein
MCHCRDDTKLAGSEPVACAQAVSNQQEQRKSKQRMNEEDMGNG